MLLVLDAGNTNTVVGIYEKQELIGHWRLTSSNRTVDEAGLLLLSLLNTHGINRVAIGGAILSSVVPALDEVWRRAIEIYLGKECLRVSSHIKLEMPIEVDAPAEVGADRLVNAVAAMDKYGYPLIAVDLGTAITLDVVSKEGAYLGGVIAPGLAVSMETLFSRTAKLPQIALEVPDRVIGKNTREAIQSGILYGYAGLIDSLVERIFTEMEMRCPVIATGGHAQVMSLLSQTITNVEPWLTLEGLRLLYERNRMD